MALKTIQVNIPLPIDHVNRGVFHSLDMIQANVPFTFDENDISGGGDIVNNYGIKVIESVTMLGQYPEGATPNVNENVIYCGSYHPFSVLPNPDFPMGGGLYILENETAFNSLLLYSYPSTIAGKRWTLQHNGTIDVLQLGALDANIHDSYNATFRTGDLGRILNRITSNSLAPVNLAYTCSAYHLDTRASNGAKVVSYGTHDFKGATVKLIVNENDYPDVTWFQANILNARFEIINLSGVSDFTVFSLFNITDCQFDNCKFLGDFQNFTLLVQEGVSVFNNLEVIGSNIGEFIFIKSRISKVDLDNCNIEISGSNRKSLLKYRYGLSSASNKRSSISLNNTNIEIPLGFLINQRDFNDIDADDVSDYRTDLDFLAENCQLRARSLLRYDVGDLDMCCPDAVFSNCVLNFAGISSAPEFATNTIRDSFFTLKNCIIPDDYNNIFSIRNIGSFTAEKVKRPRRLVRSSIDIISIQGINEAFISNLNCDETLLQIQNVKNVTVKDCNFKSDRSKVVAFRNIDRLSMSQNKFDRKETLSGFTIQAIVDIIDVRATFIENNKFDIFHNMTSLTEDVSTSLLYLQAITGTLVIKGNRFDVTRLENESTPLIGITQGFSPQLDPSGVNSLSFSDISSNSFYIRDVGNSYNPAVASNFLIAMTTGAIVNANSRNVNVLSDNLFVSTKGGTIFLDGVKILKTIGSLTYVKNMFMDSPEGFNNLSIVNMSGNPLLLTADAISTHTYPQ